MAILLTADQLKYLIAGIRQFRAQRPDKPTVDRLGAIIPAPDQYSQSRPATWQEIEQGLAELQRWRTKGGHPPDEATTVSGTERPYVPMADDPTFREAMRTAHGEWHADDGHQTWVQQIATEREAKDNAYRERDQLVAVLSKVWPSHLTADSSVDDPAGEWYNVVCIHTPAGQATWHIHVSELGMFDHLRGNAESRLTACEGWDGHTTEEKYERLSQIQSSMYPQVVAERDNLQRHAAALEQELLDTRADRDEAVSKHQAHHQPNEATQRAVRLEGDDIVRLFDALLRGGLDELAGRLAHALEPITLTGP